MTPTLSVCIVAYKDYEDIKKAITTLEDYTSKKIKKKIYIVDNGSNESNNTDFLLFCKNYNEIEYINPHDNLGFGKGHNYVLDYLKSEYHCILNPDIEFVEDSFTAIIDYMEKNRDVGMVIPKLIDMKGNIQQAYRKEVTVFDMFIRMFCRRAFPKRIKQHTLQDQDYSRPFQVPFGQGSFLVIRTELFKKLGGFDDHFFMYLEDADLCKRVNQVSKLMYFPGTKVIHKWEMGSHTSLKLFKYHVKSMNYYFKKWGLKLF